MTRFDSVLVANRGEIAVRVIAACSAAGLRTIAVYSDPDRDAAHVRAADAAIRIGGAAPSESYLSIPAILEAARVSGAGAVHPGYGFLSERAAFAAAVEESGLVFIGPPAGVIEVMGRKDKARELAVAAGVPVVPAADSITDLDAIADEVGFPLLVKAAAGGGGKGMRIVRARAGLDDAVSAARREAMTAFGDDTMLFERYVEHGRHIEVQVIADEHGNVIHLFERDCSVQRRHQKVLEEAPASSIAPSVREVVLTSAVALARAVGYVNAGTVEFLVSGDDAFFLEMNTRLQVEHPVTEAVTGLDLVGLQLGVAQGEPLPLRQEDVTVSGHAIEARVYAEDPAQGFLPQAGVASLVRWPTHARVDAALESGQRVSTHYDPMLGKVIVHAATRETARRAMVQALDETAVIGLTTNVGFLRSLVDSAAFADAAIDTAWLDAHPEAADVSVPEHAWLLAAWRLATDARPADDNPFAQGDGWRLAGPPAPVPIELTSDAGAAERRVMQVSPSEGWIRRDGRDIVVRDGGRADDRQRLEVAGELIAGHVLVDPHRVLVAYQGQTWEFARPDAFGTRTGAARGDGTVGAPMPGSVLLVAVAEGQPVAEGDALGVMEAMKMELTLKAPFDGVVASVRVAVGDQVDLGEALFVVEAVDGVVAGP